MNSERLKSRNDIDTLCHGYRTDNHGEDPLKNKMCRRVVRNVHGILHCPQCERKWKRDDNACLNFAFGFYCILDHKQRPLHLQRPRRTLLYNTRLRAGREGESLS